MNHSAKYDETPKLSFKKSFFIRRTRRSTAWLSRFFSRLGWPFHETVRDVRGGRDDLCWKWDFLSFLLWNVKKSPLLVCQFASLLFSLLLSKFYLTTLANTKLDRSMYKSYQIVVVTNGTAWLACTHRYTCTDSWPVI